MEIEKIVEMVENALEKENISFSSKNVKYGDDAIVMTIYSELLPTYTISIGDREVKHSEENDFVFWTTDDYDTTLWKINEYLNRIKDDKEYYSKHS